jgi:putative membrane protein
MLPPSPNKLHGLARLAQAPDHHQKRKADMKLILRWILNAVALMLIPELLSSIQVESYTAALISAVLLGFVNAIIRPLLILITLPITILTLGLFTLVINALMFWSVSGLVRGFVVPDFWTAFWGALLYSLLTWMVSLALSDKD